MTLMKRPGSLSTESLAAVWPEYQELHDKSTGDKAVKESTGGLVYKHFTSVSTELSNLLPLFPGDAFLELSIDPHIDILL